MTVIFPSDLRGKANKKKIPRAVQCTFWSIFMTHGQSMIAVTGELCSRFLTLKSLEIGLDVTTSKTVKRKPVITNEVVFFLIFLFGMMSSTLN